MMRIVVVGGGQAGASCVLKLRQLGFDGEVLVLSRDSTPPYERPPLSKKHLLREEPDDPTFILPADFWAQQKVDLRTDTVVEAIDPVGKSIQTGSENFQFDHLVLATGSAARRLPIETTNGLGNIFHLRDLEDANALHPQLKPGKSLVLIGGGYIGMELAATARMRGLEVTVIERDERILSRVASADLSNVIRQWHRQNGVSVIEGIESIRLSGRTAIEGVHLSDGTVVPADIVVAGVGASPNTRLAETAGLTIDNGIAVDRLGRTNHPNIWAAGDCASFIFDGQRIRLESVQNAIDQAETVAENILGANKEYQPTPTFWSEQFDHLVQIAGLYKPDMTTVCRKSSNRCSYWHYRSGALMAVEVVNDPKTFAISRRLLAEKKSPDPAAISSPDQNLKALLKSA